MEWHETEPETGTGVSKMEIPTNCSFCKQDNLTNINPEYIRGVKVRLCEANVDDKLKFLRKLITIIGNL
ncbi:PREDICTED: uncharacterized protein LOC108970940 isoform X2 [Bactrocera latifrons]|uniref:uncharacterized protein LOC108970940 isoform X2 n=1 Tax=Bactrocera latifrons TaxID=174628 RepID=UPI0008DE42B0|nr:PREDICTED: uncharacterized protein LOC108970940 isoform X2 [Bactrocera latifrons]